MGTAVVKPKDAAEHAKSIQLGLISYFCTQGLVLCGTGGQNVRTARSEVVAVSRHGWFKIYQLAIKRCGSQWTYLVEWLFWQRGGESAIERA